VSSEPWCIRSTPDRDAEPRLPEATRRKAEIGHTITILHTDGCEGAAATEPLARALAAARGDVTVETVLIEHEAQALELGFRGSPTVLVDGRDLEAEPRTPLGAMG